MNIKKPIKKLLRNHNFIYILNKYGIFAIKFITAPWIAINLGPYYLGISGFINLVINYLGKTTLGIPNSLNILSSKNKDDQDFVQEITNNSLGAISIIIGLILIFFVANNFLGLEFGQKYNFQIYLPIVLIIACFSLVNGILAIILRVYSKVNIISLAQSISPVATLMAVPFLKEEVLLWTLLSINMVATMLTAILYYWHIPFKIRWRFNGNSIKLIIKKAFFLFIYSTSFYLIILSAKSFVSANYEVIEFGYFTFSFSFANAVLLLMSSIAFLIYPKMINRFAHATNNKIRQILEQIRAAYISVSHIMIHFANMVFPVFLMLFPQYAPADDSFMLIGLTLILYNNSFGYQGLMMARNKERLLSLISFSALIANVVLCYILVHYIHVNFSYVILGTLVTYFIYVLTLGYYGQRELGTKSHIIHIFREVYPLKVLIPFTVSLSMILSGVESQYFFIPFVLYLVLNVQDIKSIIKTIKMTIKNPELLNI